MDESPLDRIPPLGGLCTRAEAARIGFSVKANVRRLLRYHWVERRLMGILIERIAATPEWEVKGALALHAWLAAERTELLRARIAEMRAPEPPLDGPPDERLERAMGELASARTTSELLTGAYAVLLPALETAYAEHREVTNPLVDHPTRRLLRIALADLGDAIAWGREALAAVGHDHAFADHIDAYLAAAGGVSGAGAPPDRPLPPERGRPDATPDFEPRRDERFLGTYNFNFPPHVLHAASALPADERNLALLCKRLLEMDVPEMMASFLSERPGMPWRFYADYARQLWDEARHSMMGEVALEARGVDWKRIPLNVGFSLRLNLHANPLERQIVLWAIEQSLMPAEGGKRSEYETALEAGDGLSAHFHDYDWADEVLHARIGRRWLLGSEGEGLAFDEAMERGRAVHERTWRALEAYRDREPQAAWWSEFVRGVLGRDTAAEPEQLGENPNVIQE